MKKLNTLNIYWVVTLLMTVAIAAPWVNIHFTSATFVKEYVGAFGISFLMLLTLWKAYSNKAQISFKLSWLKISWLSLFLLGTLSFFWSVYIDFSIGKWLLWFSILSAFIVGYRLKLDKATLLKLCWGFLISALTIAVIGICQYLFEFSSIPQAISPSSTFGNKNMATQPLILMLPFALFLLFSDEIKGGKIWAVTVSIALIMLYLFYAHTRSSWLSIGIELVLITGFLLFKRKTLGQWIDWNGRKTVASIVAFLLFMVLINFNAQGLNLFLNTVTNAVSSTDSSAQSRFEIWAVAIEMIKASPIFGTGLGSWFYNETQGGMGTVKVSTYHMIHNDILQLGVELGLAGLLLFLTSVAMTLMGLIKIIKQDNKTHAWFYYLMLVAVGGSFVQMQFSFPYQLMMPALLFGLYLGMIAQRLEKFVEPIKIIHIQALERYQTGVKSLAVIVTTVVVVIYTNWIAMYDQYNNMLKTNQISKIVEIRTMLHESHSVPIVNYLVTSAFNAKKITESLQISQYLLSYFPEYSRAIYVRAYILVNERRYQEALKVLKRLKQVANDGYYKRALRMQAEIYVNLGQNEQFRQIFDQIIQYDYEQTPDLRQWTLDIYKYYKNYNCAVENKMAGILIQQGKTQQARQHIAKINKNKGSCLAPELHQYQ